MTDYLPYRKNSWNGFISSEMNDIDLEPEKLADQGEAIVLKPNRMVRRLQLNGTTFYAKWFAPQKNIIKRLLRKPLAFKLLEIHKALLVSGIGCAKPILAAVCGDSSQKLSQLFVYKEIPYHSISKGLQQASASDATGIYLAAANAIATLHKAGFVHGDCLPGNICLSDDGQAFFIDNDRTSKSLPLLRSWQERRNLIQFCAHSAHQHRMTREMQRLFLTRYFECRSQKVAPLEPLLDRIEMRRQEIQSEEASAKR